MKEKAIIDRAAAVVRALNEPEETTIYAGLMCGHEVYNLVSRAPTHEEKRDVLKIVLRAMDAG
jgi:hypothetical protein